MAQLDRREFVKYSVASGMSAACLGAFAPGLLARSAPSERVRIGCMGASGRAGFLLEAFAKRPDVEIVAVADVDPEHLAKGIAQAAERQQRRPRAEADFRRLIDDPEIDALVIGTPDHWHAIPTIMACQAGKDVYVEKPDGHNIVEGQRMVQAQRKYGRVVQLGTQARSAPHFESAMDFIRTGKLGTCLVAKAWETAKQKDIGRPSDSRPPEGLDYDFWLGPAPKRPFNIRRFHNTWRWFFDYGTGDLGNDGVHRMDDARRALSTAVEAHGGTPLELPTKISATGGKWYFDDLQEFPDTLQVTYEFGGSPGRILTYEMRLWSPYHMHDVTEGAAVYGDQGYIVMNNRRWRAYSSDNKLIAQGAGPHLGDEHIGNFLDCVKTRRKANADLETIGHPSSLLCHAGTIAWKLGRTLVFDPVNETFINDPEANSLRTRPEYRKPWELPNV